MSGTGLSRRRLLAVGTCWLCTGGARAEVPVCEDLQAPPPVTLTAAERERDTIFLLLAMALTFDGWAVDRDRADLVAAFREAEPDREFPDYAGHNIAAVIVDDVGRVVSFALNRNVALNSTLEHAEARAVRNAIRLSNSRAAPEGPKKWSFGAILRRHDLYTTLEPCAQCAGIMDLANLQRTVFAQDDPTQHHLVDVIYNLRRKSGAAAPLPVAADFFPLWQRLAEAARLFYERAARTGGPAGATAFLQTVEAYRLFREGAQLLEAHEAENSVNASILEDVRALRRGWGPFIAAGVGPA